MRDDDACPCGGGRFGTCCGPLLRGERDAATAEQLMRSRYTAFAVGDADHLARTWHPHTPPAEVTVDPRVVWTRLRVLDVVAGGVDDAEGEVASAHTSAWTARRTSSPSAAASPASPAGGCTWTATSPADTGALRITARV